jgi:hypothetical protein
LQSDKQAIDTFGQGITHKLWIEFSHLPPPFRD